MDVRMEETYGQLRVTDAVGRVTVPSGGDLGHVPAPAPLATATAGTVMGPGAR